MKKETPSFQKYITPIAPVAIGIYSWKVSEDVVFADEYVAELFNLSPALAKNGMPIECYIKSIHRDDVERVTAAIAKAVSTGEGYNTEYRIVSPSGDVRHVLAVGQCFLGSDGCAVEWAGSMFALDVESSAEDKANRVVDACIEAYKAADRAKATFVKYLLSMVLIELGQAAVAELEADSTVH
ncbi:PAS domain-containing protein [Pararhizobium arenae]|uniref:PAS domain-containing protein n=1 Tax=Pararhizobium arenae TaxID=1856850 RepID=UPI000AE6F44C|nr:PAS domain-containing protein [Pararhizobium arenae]